MRTWLRSIQWLPLTIAALIIILGFNTLSWLGFPASHQPPVFSAARQPSHGGEDWVAFFTFTLTFSTILLWWSTAELADEARDSAKKLLKIETPYVTGGGDFVRKTGVELFRLDVENHGKTPAFMTAYDLQFAQLADLQEEERQKKKPRPLREKHCRFRHIDGISPTGGRKEIFTQIPLEPDADVVFGAVWYEDPILGDEHHSRFILRIAPTRDIPGEGLTRLDVKGVNRDYWSWDYREHMEA